MRLSSFHLPVNRLSATSLTEFITCAELFRLKRLVKKPERRYLELFIGTVFHRTIEDNFRHKLTTGQDLEWEEILEGYRFKWDEEIKDEEPEWTDPPLVAYETGAKVLESWHRDVAPLVTPVAVEQRFEVDIPGIPVPIVGNIDVESRGFIEDFKTSSRKEAKAKPRWRFQGRIYQLQVEKPVAWYVTTKQVTPVSYTPVDNPGLLMYPINRDVTVELLKQTVEQLNDVYARYGKDRPWPTNGLLHEWMCGKCSYGPKSTHPICPAWRINDTAAA